MKKRRSPTESAPESNPIPSPDAVPASHHSRDVRGIRGVLIRPLIRIRGFFTKRPYLIHALIWATLFLVIQGLLWPRVNFEGRRYFLDPDAYTWLSRAQTVLSEPVLYVHDDPLNNYPEGFTSHWTQPFHWLLALAALVVGLFADGASALEIAGVWISPILGAFTLALLAAWVNRRWSWPAALAATIVFMVNPFEIWTFSLGRPDHQALLVLFLLPALLLLIRSPDEAGSPRRDDGSALLVGLALWVSVQALSVWALFLGGLTLGAVTTSPEARDGALRRARRFAAVSGGAALLFAVLERPGELSALPADSLCLAHGAILLLAAGGLSLSIKLHARFSRAPFLGRFVLMAGPGAGLAIAGAAALWFYDRAGQSPELSEATGRWFATNLEFLPALFFVNGEAALGRLHESLGFTLYLLPAILYGLFQTKRLDGASRWILSAGLVLGSAMTLWQMRWRDLHALFIAPSIAVGLLEAVGRVLPDLRGGLIEERRFRIGPVLLALVCVVVTCWPWVVSTEETLEAGWTKGVRPDDELLALAVIADAIREEAAGSHDPGGATGDGNRIPDDGRRTSGDANSGEAGVTESPGAVLASWDHGPMIRYLTGLPVIAGPYHRNMAGILDTFRAYAARTPGPLREVLDRRRVAFVVRPPTPDPSAAYYDVYTAEEVLATPDPLLFIRTRRVTPDGKKVVRGYDLTKGHTPEDIYGVFRCRLDRGDWKGWWDGNDGSDLVPVMTPGLARFPFTADAAEIPYLYRVEK